MPVIAVVNRKGGSGKSTIATHLASWCAQQGLAVMLGDVDRQQSSRAWLRRRSAELPTILPWALTQTNLLRVPTGVTHVVLDTPGGLHGLELAKVVMFADAILIPVGPSVFDRDSATDCYAELSKLPRVARGRCKVAALGMRIDARTNGARELQTWAHAQALPLLGVIAERYVYVRCADHGTSIFDLHVNSLAQEREQWEAVLNWISPVVGLETQLVSARPENCVRINGAIPV